RKNQPLRARTDMEGIDKNDRRAGHIDEQSGKRERAANGVGMKLRMADDRRKAFKDGARLQGDFRVRRVAFGKQEADDEHQTEREGGENDEYPRPARRRRDQPADRGREKRRD